LKSAYDASDESVVYTFLENPYWQYFLGFEFFQHNFPLDPTSLVKWRHRIGSEALEMLLHELLETAQRMKFLKPSDMHRVTVDNSDRMDKIHFNKCQT